MAWRMIKQPNGLYARFSEVVDDFTDYDMTRDEAIDCCLEFMGRRDAPGKVDKADENPGRYEEAMGIIREVHGAEFWK